jgi:predicted ATP-dependent endonuclease of OLD family/ribosomal protein S18 acetylase RimI-like enzyme
MEIRSYTEADYQFTHDLHRKNMLAYVDEYWGGWDSAIFRKDVCPKSTWIIEHENQKAGFFILNYGKIAHIKNIQVSSDFQNIGLGSKVLKHCEKECLRNMHKTLYLEVFLDNPARILYERLGYKTYEVTESHFKMKKELGDTMELVFMWVRKYGHLRNIEFNFDGKHLFHFEIEEGMEKKYEIEPKISAEPNPHHLNDFFNINKKKTNIHNIIGIIGENGTGKSTILEVIHSISPKLKDAFFILKKGNKYYHTDLMYPDYPDNEKCVLIEKSFKKFKIERITNNLPNVIFYSNVFQPSTFKHFTEKDPLDISTMKYLYEGKNKTKPIETVFTEYNLEELNRQMVFVGHYDTIFSEDFGFEMPTQITILESYLFINYKNEIDENDLNSNLVDLTHKINFFGLINQKFKNGQNILRFSYPNNLNRILKNMFIQWFINNANSENIEFRKLEKSVLRYSGDPNEFYTYLKTLKNDSVDLLLKIFDLLVAIAFNSSSNLISDKIAGNFKNDKKVFIEIVKKLQSSAHTSNLLQFKWRDMSSGEMAILTLFSRFHSIKNYLKSDNIIILLDEPDMYLHPSWIQKLILVLIKYLNMDFSGKYIQIILTSNKPICTSDLPANNVIMLEKKGYDKDNWPKIEVKKDNFQPFGANIYSLYKEGL